MRIKITMRVNGRRVRARGFGKIETAMVSMGASGDYWTDGVIISVYSEAGEHADAESSEFIQYCLNEAGELDGRTEGSTDWMDPAAPEYSCEYRITLSAAERDRLAHLCPHYAGEANHD